MDEPWLVIPPRARTKPQKHRHHLPDAEDYDHDTLVKCSCDRWFVVDVIRDGDTSAKHVWQPVRWFNFVLRRRIREFILAGKWEDID